MFGIPSFNFKKDIWIVLSSILIIHVAAFLIVPIFPILLKTQKNLNPSQVGIVIGAGSLFIQLGSIVAGFMGSKLGNKYTLIVGNACQALALFGLGLSHSFIFLLLFSAFNGVGTGIYVPTVKSSISFLASAEHRTTAFSLRAVAANIGTSIAGVIVLLSSTNQNFYMAGGIYILLMALTWILLPKDCGDQPCPTFPLRSFIDIFKDRRFLFFSLVSALIWAIHTQLGLLLPLRAEAILENTNVIGTIWTITSIVVIVFQPLISKHFLQKHPPVFSMFIGVILIGTGITLIGWSNSFYFLIFCALVFIFGEMFMMPTLDSVTSMIADPQLVGVYFSVANFASGLGAALGNFASGKIIDVYGIAKSFTPWIIFSIFTLFVALLLRLPSIKSLEEKKSP